MTNPRTAQEILEKAIRKAKQNGYKERLAYFDIPESFIFNHDFAKALWGEQEDDYDQGGNKFVEKWGWQHHLQQMVIADDPIKYLGEHI